MERVLDAARAVFVIVLSACFFLAVILYVAVAGLPQNDYIGGDDD